MKKILFSLLISCNIFYLSALDLSRYSYFVGSSLNYNFVGVEKSDKKGEIILNKQLDKYGLSTNIQAGVYIKDYTLSLNYDILNLDDVKLYTTYLSLDYNFKYPLNPFVGFSLGNSDMKWKEDILVDSKTKDIKLSSAMYGIQAGFRHILTKHWSICEIVSYQKFNFKTTLISAPALSEIRHNDRVFFGVGLRYNFN